MTPEIWAALSAFLIAVAAIAGGLTMFKVPGRWVLVATGARAVAAMVVAAALIYAVIAQGEWTPLDPRQMVLAMLLAMLAIHLVLAWRLRIGNAGPAVDVVALVLLLCGALVVQPEAIVPSCFQRALPYQVQWGLFTFGGGSVLVAGSAGLEAALHRISRSRDWNFQLPQRGDLCSLLTQAIFPALVALGGGLTVSVWWAWRTVGTLATGDPGLVWLVIAWLIAGTSLLAWQLEAHREGWAAGLATLAAAILLLGLLGTAVS
jgi:hypothetical protein